MRRQSIRDIILVILFVIVGLAFVFFIVWYSIEKVQTLTTKPSSPSGVFFWVLTIIGSLFAAIYKINTEAKKEKEEEQKNPYYYRGFKNGKIQIERYTPTRPQDRKPKRIQCRRRITDIFSHLKRRPSVLQVDKGLCNKHFNINYKK